MGHRVPVLSCLIVYWRVCIVLDMSETSEWWTDEILDGNRQMLHRSEYHAMRGTVPSCETGRYRSDKAKGAFGVRVYQLQGRAGFLKLVSCISINQKHLVKFEIPDFSRVTLLIRQNPSIKQSL